MNVQIKFDDRDDRQKILNGTINQHISVLNPERLASIYKGKLLSVFHNDEYLYDALLEQILQLRFYRRITHLPYIAQENRYMNEKELKEFIRRGGYKNHIQFFFMMSKLYGKYLAKETYLVVRFQKAEPEETGN